MTPNTQFIIVYMIFYVLCFVGIVVGSIKEYNKYCREYVGDLYKNNRDRKKSELADKCTVTMIECTVAMIASLLWPFFTLFCIFMVVIPWLFEKLLEKFAK